MCLGGEPVRWTSKALAVALAIVVAGCSFFMDTVPDDWQPSSGPPKCDDSFADPGDDIGFVAALAAVAVISIAANCPEDGDNVDGNCEDATGGAVVFGLVALPYSYAAYRGFRKRSKCERAKREYESWQLRPAH